MPFEQTDVVAVNAIATECRAEESLGGNLSGWWSRRINREHRLVYRVTGKGEGQALEVAQCRYRY